MPRASKLPVRLALCRCEASLQNLRERQRLSRRIPGFADEAANPGRQGPILQEYGCSPLVCAFDMRTPRTLPLGVFRVR
jgi:hypothetical protein